MKKIFCPKCGKELIPMNELYSYEEFVQEWYCDDCHMDIRTSCPVVTEEPSPLPNWIDYLYIDYQNYGDYFFVEIDRNQYDTDEDALTTADEIASENFECPLFIRTCTKQEADELGYDTF